MLLVHFTNNRTSEEYIIFLDVELGEDLVQHCRSGFDVESVTDLEDVDLPGSFPIETELERA